MKKLFTLASACLALLANVAYAQTNLNFENWSGNEPSGWSTANSITQASGGAQTTFRVTTNTGEGSSSVRMVTGSCPTCPDFALFGDFFPPTPLPNPFGGMVQLGSFLEPGIAYTQRPISVDVRYKANPGNNDACGFQVELTKYNAATDEDETVGEGYFEVTADVANWTNINVPIVYYTNQTPDRLNIWATSSIGSVPDLSGFGLPTLPLPTPVAGSEFFIDAIVLNLPSCNSFSIGLSGQGESSLGAGDGSASVVANGDAAPYTYSWNTLESTSSINGLIPGLYFVTVTDANGCQKTGQYYVSPGGCNLNVSISGTNSSTNSIYTGNGTASVTVSGGNAPYEYLWNTGATTASISNLPVGTYAVLITEANNPICATWAYFTVYGPNGAPSNVEEKIGAGQTLQVYPNPTSDAVFFQSNEEISGLEVYSITGALVWRGEQRVSKYTVDLTHQPTGIYFYKVKTTDGNWFTGKLIKQ
jgi:hypothetical protein